MAISEEDLRGLSAAEREALLSVDEEDEDVARELRGIEKAPATTQAPAPGAEVNDEDDEGESSQTPAPAPVESKTADTPAPAASPTLATEQADEDDVVRQVQTPRATPDNAAEQRNTLRNEQSAALKQLMDGEITQDAYNKISGDTQDRLESLVRAEATDQARETITRDAMMQDYSKALSQTQKAVRTAGLDLSANDGVIGKELDRAVRMFAEEATARGLMDAPGNLAASKAALEDAKDLILRRYGKATAPVAAPSPASAPAPRKPAPPDRSQFPPTLAAVPAAADATITTEFAQLDGLTGSSLERALAKLTPEQQDRYLG